MCSKKKNISITNCGYLILSPFCYKCTHLISELEIVEYEIVKYFLLILSFIFFFSPKAFISIN